MTLIPMSLLVLAAVFPSATPASWMSPESFHLELGESREDVEALFSERGWELEKGKAYEELVHEYDEGRIVSLSFLEDVLVSARFELATFPPESRKAFDELREVLGERFGEPKPLATRILSYGEDEVSVHLVLLDRFEGSTDRSPVEVVIARYFLRR